MNALRIIAALLVMSALGPVPHSFSQTMKETNPPPAAKQTSSTAARTPAPAATAHHDLTDADLETFLDGFMPTQLARETSPAPSSPS